MRSAAQAMSGGTTAVLAVRRRGNGDAGPDGTGVADSAGEEFDRSTVTHRMACVISDVSTELRRCRRYGTGTMILVFLKINRHPPYAPDRPCPTQAECG
jgi:hypothetical protein